MEAVFTPFLTASNAPVAVGLIILIATGFFVFGRRIYLSQKYRLKALRALGFYQETRRQFADPKTGVIKERVVKSKIKVRWSRNRLEFSKYNIAFSLADFERLRPNLELLFGRKFEAISSERRWIPFLQPKIVLFAESFVSTLTVNECPPLEPGQAWLGKTGLGEHLILDIINKFQFSLGIFSQAGGGKGNAIASFIVSFFEAWLKKFGKHPYEFIVLDAKGTDYLSLLKKYEGQTYNPIFVDELKEAVQRLELYTSEVNEYRRYLAQCGVSVAHWFEIAEHYPELKTIPRPIVLVVDEASQFLAPRPSIKITKDSTDDERLLKERYDLEARLAFLIDSILQLFRSSGAVVLISTQASREGDLTIDRTNIRTLLLGQQNATQSRLLTGSDVATDSTLVRGKFIFVGDGVVKKIQVPFALKAEPPKKGGGK